MKRPTLIYASLALLGFVFVGYVGQAAGAKDETYQYLSNFSDTLELVQRNYVEEPELGPLVDGAYRGLLEELDPESFYLPAALVGKYSEASSSAGRADIGIDISKRHGYGVVISVLPGSPAESLLKPGDYLRMIDGISTRPLSVFEIRQRLMGAPGSDIELKVQHRDTFESDVLKLKRAEVTIPSVAVRSLDGPTLFLHPRAIDTKSMTEMTSAIRSATELQAVVLDLRGCSRGSIADGARLADLFLDTGTLLHLTGKVRADAIKDQLGDLQPVADRTASGFAYKVMATPERTTWRGPLVVLTDPSTAGAAEVAAAAVRRADRASVVGRRTLGRAALQTLFPLGDGSAVQLTFAHVMATDDKSLLGGGLEPSEPVEATVDDTEDPVLERALELLEKDGRKKKAA